MTRPSNYKIGITIKVPRHKKVKLKSLRGTLLTVIGDNEIGPIVIHRGWIDGRLSASREVLLVRDNLTEGMLQVSPRTLGYSYSPYSTLGDWLDSSRTICGLQLKWAEINSFTTNEDKAYYKSKLCKFYVKQGLLTDKEVESNLEVLRNVVDDTRGSVDVPY